MKKADTTKHILENIDLSPLFPMEESSDQLEVSSPHKPSRELTQFFASQNPQVPQEDFSYSRTIGQKRFSLLWRPNNYRRKISIKKSPDSGSTRVRTHYQNLSFGKGMVFIRDYPDVTLQVGRKTLIGIYRQRRIAGVKETFVLEADSRRALLGLVEEKKAEKRDLIDKAMFDFLEVSGLRLDGELPVWCHVEDWIQTEDLDNVLRKVPREARVIDSRFKKVYDSGIEFTDPTLLSNYVSNMTLQDVYPELLSEIRSIRLEMVRMRKGFTVAQEEAVRREGLPRSQKKLLRWSK